MKCPNTILEKSAYAIIKVHVEEYPNYNMNIVNAFKEIKQESINNTKIEIIQDLKPLFDTIWTGCGDIINNAPFDYFIVNHCMLQAFHEDLSGLYYIQPFATPSEMII